MKKDLVSPHHPVRFLGVVQGNDLSRGWHSSGSHLDRQKKNCKYALYPYLAGVGCLETGHPFLLVNSARGEGANYNGFPAALAIDQGEKRKKFI